jgi:hypothetical protein
MFIFRLNLREAFVIAIYLAGGITMQAQNIIIMDDGADIQDAIRKLEKQIFVTTQDKENDEEFTEDYSKKEDIYEKIIALKKQYPEGMTWTNNNYYQWKGGVYTGGYGCLGFAFILSDAAFGNLPARKHYDFNNIKIGDILKMDNAHYVIIIGIDEKNITFAEGNYNSSIHWGRKVTVEKVKKTSNYVLTRYVE